MNVSFELSEDDLEHFRGVMVKARNAAQGKDVRDIVRTASQLLRQVNASQTSDFIRDRMAVVETLIGMVMDESWGLVEDDRQRVVDALAYFSEADDLIPDNIPGLGFLDDAIMVEIVCEELKHEIQAYRDFVVFKAAEQARMGDDAEEVEREDWLETRRQQLHSRMRRRRRRGSEGGGRRSPFSLF